MKQLNEIVRKSVEKFDEQLKDRLQNGFAMEWVEVSELARTMLEETLISSQISLLEEIKKYVDEKEVTFGVTQSDSYQIGQNHGRQGYRRDLITYLESEIKKIKELI